MTRPTSTETPPSQTPPRRSALLVVYLTVFLDLLGFGMILPLLPFYALRFGVKGAAIGILFASYSLAQFLGAAVLGRISDRVGRRPVLLFCVFGSALSLFAAGLSNSFPTLLAARALAGLFGGSIATAQAYIADVTRPEERVRYMGMIGAAVGMGFVLGPWVGAELSRFGFGTAAFVASGLAVVNLISAFFALPESRPPSQRGSSRAPFRLAQLRAALSRPVIGSVLIAGGLTTLAMVCMESTFALMGQKRFGLDERGMGRIFLLIGAVMAAVQGGVVGPLVRRFGERAMGILGAVLLAGVMGSLPFLPSLALVVASMVLVATGQGLLVPSMSSLLSRASGVDEQGSVLGLGQSLGAAARCIGPPCAGLLFDQALWLPYVLSAALLVAVILVFSTLPAVFGKSDPESAAV